MAGVCPRGSQLGGRGGCRYGRVPCYVSGDVFRYGIWLSGHSARHHVVCGPDNGMSFVCKFDDSLPIVCIAAIEAIPKAAGRKPSRAVGQRRPSRRRPVACSEGTLCAPTPGAFAGRTLHQFIGAGCALLWTVPGAGGRSTGNVLGRAGDAKQEGNGMLAFRFGD